MFHMRILFLIRDNTQLQEDVDSALKSMKEDGTIAKLSKEILGDDYTKSE